ncbi:sigma-70 family RNA polymerase sigma factor [Aliikangiella marina]|uniref:Sigma-70 family RNA polymerase sigma factor n=1 Tax=Aliikangiella marina TaxID=1712262 RepID=A0A545T2Y1_9GAMM|nr:sigma-70 family RNA polymerase sigma factor [Aliikangiella marina]TQV71558.1 sigma-70 family RNA polymerase sigma factor [Aliikangiella marina]
MESEKQLIAQVKIGNIQAFQELVDTYSHKLYSAAYRILGDRAHAEDCIQEVFLKIYRKIDSFDDRSKFSTWLYSITVNTAIDMQRSMARHQHTQPLETSVIEKTESKHQETPEAEHWQRDLSKLTQKALAELSEDLRMAFLLKHFDGRSIEEISQILEINPNTVKNRIFRAVNQLKKLMSLNLSVSEVIPYE